VGEKTIMSDNLDCLRQIAEAFRAALEKYRQSADDVIFKDFPVGACSPTSDLLATYLIDALGLNAQCAVSLKLPTHAWVTIEDTIIDITADQFEQGPVICENYSRWHEELPEQERRPPSRRNEWNKEEEAAWNFIIDEMSQRGFPVPE